LYERAVSLRRRENIPWKRSLNFVRPRRPSGVTGSPDADRYSRFRSRLGATLPGPEAVFVRNCFAFADFPNTSCTLFMQKGQGRIRRALFQPVRFSPISRNDATAVVKIPEPP